MYALSINNPYAQLVVLGIKTLEVRSWSTKYRGDVLICASKKTAYWCDVEVKTNAPKCFSLLYENVGCAIGTALLWNCRPMTPEDESESFVTYKEGLFVFEFIKPQRIIPFPVKGQLGFFNVDYKL